MGKSVLFSPIGTTDPITDYHDGSMLHICRIKQPDVVYLYLSKEMLEYHDKDDRYVQAIELLGGHIRKKFDVKLIKRPYLANVQIFDSFFDDFETEIRSIFEVYGDDTTLYLNVSSGTPAMKSTLQIIAATMDTSKNIIAIQVDTPSGKANKRHDKPSDFDLAVSWETDEDNDDGFKVRARISDNNSLYVRIQKENIIKHITAYDYHAAATIAKSIEVNLVQEAVGLIDIACQRICLDKQCLAATKEYSCKEIIPYRQDGILNLYEYALWISMKQKRKDYADFVRAMTPFVYESSRYYLKYIMKIDIEDYCITKKDVKWLCREELEKKEEGLSILEALDDGFSKGYEDSALSEKQMIAIIKYIDNNKKVKDLFDKLRSIEYNIRNKVAHIITMVDDDVIKRDTGYTSDDIVDIIKRTIKIMGFSTTSGYWDSYDKMNEIIIDKVKLIKTNDNKNVNL